MISWELRDNSYQRHYIKKCILCFLLFYLRREWERGSKSLIPHSGLAYANSASLRITETRAPKGACFLHTSGGKTGRSERGGSPCHQRHHSLYNIDAHLSQNAPHWRKAGKVRAHEADSGPLTPLLHQRVLGGHRATGRLQRGEERQPRGMMR